MHQSRFHARTLNCGHSPCIHYADTVNGAHSPCRDSKWRSFRYRGPLNALHAACRDTECLDLPTDTTAEWSADMGPKSQPTKEIRRFEKGSPELCASKDPGGWLHCVSTQDALLSTANVRALRRPCGLPASWPSAVRSLLSTGPGEQHTLWTAVRRVWGRCCTGTANCTA